MTRPDNSAHRGCARLLQFGVFELRTDTGELRKHGVRVRLQAKPLQVLLALLEHPGEVVTREQLQQRLWAADIFVDFESGLNTAANRLRIALGDSADVPRFVETLPRVGYRFIAPVRELPANRPTLEMVERPPAAVVAILPSPVDVPAGAPWLTTKWVWIACTVSVLVFSVLVWRALSTAARGGAAPEFHQITFAQGDVTSARFAPDASTVLYTRYYGGESRLYAGNALSPEAQALDFRNAALAAVSRSGELALMYHDADVHAGVLMRTPMRGGPGREVARGVMGADWSPDGENLALIRPQPSGAAIEFPVGKVVFRCTGWASCLRVSPSGKRLAFLEHPKLGDDAGHVRVVESNGQSRVLSSSWGSAEGLAWAPSEHEIWFTASKVGTQRSLYAVTLDNQTRSIAGIPGTLRLLDVSGRGQVLLCRDDLRMSMSGIFAGSRTQEDVPGFDYSQVNDISRDGNLVLFTESGDAGGSNYGVYIHNHRTHSTERIGHGQALALSPDGREALALDIRDQTLLRLIPLAAGDEQKIPPSGLRYEDAMFFPDGRRLLVTGAYPGQPMRMYVQALSGGPPTALNTPVYLSFPVISPDGGRVLGKANGTVVILSLDTMRLRELPRQLAPLRPVGWSQDGRSILLTSVGGSTWQLMRADVDGGHNEVLSSFTPPNSGGMMSMSGVAATPAGTSCVYSFARHQSQLYVVDGWLDVPRGLIPATLMQ